MRTASYTPRNWTVLKQVNTNQLLARRLWYVGTIVHQMHVCHRFGRTIRGLQCRKVCGTWSAHGATATVNAPDSDLANNYWLFHWLPAVSILISPYFGNSIDVILICFE